MSTHVSDADTARAPAADRTAVAARGSARDHRSRRRVVVAAVIVVVVATAVTVGLVATSSAPPPPATTVVTLVSVTQRSISSQTQVSATLGYAGSYSVINQAQGTVTKLPAVGDVVNQGQVLYEVSGNPVILLTGTTPAYRTLATGTSGPDVEQLNADLVALGYATSSELSPTSDQFSSATQAALEALQAHLGVNQTGTLALGQAVFLPSAVRVTSVSATLGGPAQPGQPVLSASSTARVVTVQLDANLQADVKVGDQVTIRLPDHTTTPGVVSSVGKVATTPSGNGNGNGGSSSPTIAVTITPTDSAATGSLDQAPVSVAITNATVPDALVVPVTALLALAGGGYALEVVPTHGPHYLVPVTTGLFDDADGLVQVTGPDVHAGVQVVTPSAS